MPTPYSNRSRHWHKVQASSRPIILRPPPLHVSVWIFTSCAKSSALSVLFFTICSVARLVWVVTCLLEEGSALHPASRTPQPAPRVANLFFIALCWTSVVVVEHLVSDRTARCIVLKIEIYFHRMVEIGPTYIDWPLQPSSKIFTRPRHAVI